MVLALSKQQVAGRYLLAGRAAHAICVASTSGPLGPEAEAAATLSLLRGSRECQLLLAYTKNVM